MDSPNKGGSQNGSQQGGKDGNNSDKITVRIGEESKTLTADDVKGLLEKEASVTQKAQSVAEVMKAADRYGLTPEEFLLQSEGAFRTMANLMDHGVIDKTGKIITESKPKDEGAKNRGNQSLGGNQGGSGNQTDDVLSIVKQAMGDVLGPVTKRMEQLESDQDNLIRLDFERQLMKAHPNLDKDDVSRIFATASHDRKKTLFDHAADYAADKDKKLNSMKAEWAKEMGIDLEQANRLKEMGSEGGASALIKGKKVKFGASSKDPNVVSPLKAAREFLARQRLQQ